MSLPVPCELCHYPLVLCLFHPPKLVPYEEPSPSSFYSNVIDGINPGGADGGEPSTAETFWRSIASAKQVAASNSRRKTYLGWFHCTLCSQNFTAKHNLQSTSHSALPIFASLIYSLDHYNSHYRRKDYHCVPDGCGSSFTMKTSLKRHRQTCKKAKVKQDWSWRSVSEFSDSLMCTCDHFSRIHAFFISTISILSV